jgi:acyl-CoA synthetase (AMP-forming)/AMP-acid ligase II
MDDSDTEVPLGTSGEICIGPSDDPDVSSLYHLMLGYWRNEAASSRTLRGGVLHTGDVGFVDPEGYLHVQDRHQSLILRGGANVYPAEVERIINEFPHIAGSCVVGVPDDRLGARVAAVVELEGTEQDEGALDTGALRAYCRANLARYKVPEVFLVRTLPRNAMGKVILGDVRLWVEQLDLNLDAPPSGTEG